MTKFYTAYIDEAGDEGFGKLAAGHPGGQSRWLILGACIVSRENDLKLPNWRDEIVARFPLKKRRELHFRDLKHEQKVVVSQCLSELPLDVCVALSHKITIPGSSYEETFKSKGYLYNYLLRWLLERVTTACAQAAGPESASLKVVFSRRGGTDYQAMMDYLRMMRDGEEKIPPARSIRWDVLNVDSVVVESHGKWAGLQFADCCTSAFFNAVEPNVYGNYEVQYARLLKKRLIRANGSSLNCGLTAVPSIEKSALDPAQRSFFLSMK